MIKFQYTKHLLNRIKIRGLSKTTIEKTVTNPDALYYDNLNETIIAIRREPKKNFMTAYKKDGNTINLITSHQIKNRQIENRVKSRRWIRYD